MNIKSCEIELGEVEIRQQMDRHVADIRTSFLDIEGLSIAIEEGRAYITCTLNPFLSPRTPGVVELGLKPNKDGKSVDVELLSVTAKVTALGCIDLNFDGDKTKNMICDAIKKKFEGQSWFAINDRTITVNLEAIMQGKGVSISGCLVAADICDDKICLSWERRVEAQYE